MIIEVKDLHKSYGSVNAVNGLSFSIEAGEIFALLGPNGAGKTTTLNIIEGLRPADNGTVCVFGQSVAENAAAIKRRIGVQLQSTTLLPKVNAVEQIMLFARLYDTPLHRAEAMQRLEQVGLAEKATSKPDDLSGGQQQRLSLALALVNNPDIVFLDEPTAGLDPQSRRMLWKIIRELQAEGRTVVLTTHYMEEAEALANRVGIIDHGQLLALDTPGALINGLEGLSTITTTAPLPHDAIHTMACVENITINGAQIRISTRDAAAATAELLQLSADHGIRIKDLHIQQPSLEDVFLELTGRTIRN